MKTKRKNKPPRRRKNGTFEKGCSGNPGGRPKGLREVQEYAQLYTFEMIDVQVEIALNRKASKTARVKAADRVLSRGWGKPTQPIELMGKDGKPIETRTDAGFDFSKLSVDELKVWRELAAKSTKPR